jgi:hypothetical protein
MWTIGTLIAASALVPATTNGLHDASAQAEAQQSADPIKCEYVVSADPGAKPTRLCLPQSQWAAKKKQDAANPERIVCHYEEQPGERFSSRKICMSAAQWDDRRLQDRQDVERIQQEGSMLRGP